MLHGFDGRVMAAQRLKTGLNELDDPLAYPGLDDFFNVAVQFTCDGLREPAGIAGARIVRDEDFAFRHAYR